MLLSDNEFEKLYGETYKQKLSEATFFVDNPKSLKEKITLENSELKEITTPHVDEFSHKMTYYKGFVQFPNRLKNYIVSQHEEHSKIRNFLPSIMDLEPNSRCNFKCIMCHVSSWENGKRAEDMSLEDFKTFIDANPNFIEVKLHGMGEPLLHKDYFKMVEYLSSQHIWTRTSINGSLLHKNENYKRLIDAQIGEVQCSFDGATKEVYEKIRVNSNFEKIVSNFTLLNEYANTKDRPYTRMWALIQNNNRHQLFEFVELAHKMKFKRMTFSITLNDWGRDEWHEINQKLQSNGLTQEEKDEIIKLSKRYDIDITVWEQANKYSTSDKKELCPWIFNRPYISSDLKIVPCCMIADPEVVNFGEMQNFKTLWNSEKYQDFRQQHLNGNIPQCCKNCYKGEE